MFNSSNPRLRLRADEVASCGNPAAGEYNNSIGVFWLSFVGLMTVVFCAPFLRLILWLPDEGVLLHGGERLLQGEKIYVDFFEVLPPGGFLITAAWLATVGISFVSARWLAILTIVGIACFTYLACRQVTRHASSSALVAIGWVIMSQGIWTQINHHWFTTLFSTAAVWATLAHVGHSQSALRWPLVAGLTAGAAAMVTQTRGALVMLAAATVFVNFRRARATAVAYACASLFIPLSLLAYIVGQGAFVAAFDSVVLFPAKQYVTFQGVPYGEFADVRNFPLVTLFPLTAILALLTYIREWHAGRRDPLLRPCVAFGLAGAIGFLPRMDAVHITFAAPLVCPLFVYCISRLTQNWRLRYHVAAATVIVGLCLPSLYGLISLSQAARSYEVVPTPRGLVTVSPELHGLKQLVARIGQTPPEDAYFFYPFAPTLPFLTARRHVSRYDVFLPPGYALPTQYQEACIGLMRRAPWIVIDRRFTDPDYLRMVFPALRDTRPPETRRFEQALETGFAMVAREGPFEMRRRGELADEAVCAGIAE